MKLPSSLSKNFPPSADAIWNRLRPAADNVMLRQIAQADFGHLADEMFDLLRKIRDRDEWTVPIHRQLIEVLQLTRWCDPDRPEKPPFDPGPMGTEGHLTRLWACVAILRAADVPEASYRHDNYGSTIAQALVSARHFDREINVALAQYLAWRLSQPEPCDQHLQNILGMLVLVLRLVPEQQREPLVEVLIGWLEMIDAEQARDFGRHDPIDSRPVDFSIASGFWKPLVQEANTNAGRIASSNLRERLMLSMLLFEA